MSNLRRKKTTTTTKAAAVAEAATKIHITERFAQTMVSFHKENVCIIGTKKSMYTIKNQQQKSRKKTVR